MTTPPHDPDDEPRSEPFRPMSYDLAPEFGTPPPVNNPGPYPPPPPAQPQPATYQQPAYQQPAYQPPPPQPVYAPPPPPQPVLAPPAPKKGHGLRITLAVVGGVIVVCAIAACVFLYPYVKESSHVTAPPTLPGGLTKQDTDESKALADSLATELRKDSSTSIDETAVGVYSAGDDPSNIVVLAAGTGTFFSPGAQVDSAFTGFGASDGVSIGAPQTYHPGKLGGTVKCADGTSSSQAVGKVSMCVWADHGSVGLVVFIGRTADEAAPLFVQIREAVQTREI
ncbi:hypothetical protein [Dactylosporangium sp. CA-092794]|uniref:hypothetical protein n=1 Tax=Dactylosporangium sp. CA-092794 TaxID=3239929 RepID=UPI003D8FF45B